MVDFAQYSLVAVACTIIPISLILWLFSLDRLFQGHAILDLVPRRPVPWTVIDLILFALVAVVVLFVSQWICLRQFDLPKEGWGFGDLEPSQQIGVFVVSSIAILITCLITIGLYRWRCGATASDLGFVFARWRRDVALGIGAYVMLIVPVLGIHFVAQLLFETEETHPFIDLIMKDPRPEYLLPVAFAALVAAPIAEEFIFRVLLQGWFERIASRLQSPPVVTAEACPPSDTTGPAIDELPDHSVVPPPPPSSNDDGLPSATGLRILVIIASSSVFALAHLGQGPAPISLFVLALGIGYLYQRTHRIGPGIVVHFLVNLTAVAQLAITIADQPR